MERYLGGTTNNNATEYIEKKKYALFLQQSGHQMLDTLYRDSLYGFINRDYEIIAPTPDVGDFGSFAEGVPVLPWVANQFTDFRDYYFLKLSEGSVSIPSLISELAPIQSYENYETRYTSYIETIKSKLVTRALASNNPYLADLDSFI